MTTDDPVSERMPLVSVLMPVYNAARHLREAVMSVLGQSFSKLELVVVDDGSVDQSSGILHEFARRDSRVRILSGAHAGLVSALNRGLEAARGRWIARMDADDICTPDRLEAQLAFLRARPEVAVLASYAWYIGDSGRPLGVHRVGPTTVEEFRRVRARGELLRLIHPTVVMARDVVLDAGGYDARFLHVEDLELFDRLANRGHVLLAMPRPTLYYRIHRQSVVMKAHLELSRRHRHLEAVAVARRDRADRSLSYEEFLGAEESASLPRRFRVRLADWASYLYRRGGVEFGLGNRFVAAACLTAAFVLKPGRVLRKLRDQALPAGGRAMLKNWTGGRGVR